MAYVTYDSDIRTYRALVRACADDPVKASLLELVIELRSAFEYHEGGGGDPLTFAYADDKLERAYEALGFRPL